MARSAAAKDDIFDYHPWFDDLTGEHPMIGDVIDHPCGTSGCLGGWGAILNIAGSDGHGRLIRIQNACGANGRHQARTFYGIDNEEASYLFYGAWHQHGLDAPEQDILAKLDNIITTGKVINREFDARYKGDLV